MPETRPGFPRLLAPLLRRRLWCVGLLAVAGLHWALISSGRPGLPCFIRDLAGVPCPGCGLGGATLHFVRGHFAEALTRHAFAPVFILALILAAVVGVLPDAVRGRVIGRLDQWESRQPIGPIFVATLLLYWGLRLF